MRISDWSSDVCSSDLGRGPGVGAQEVIQVLGEPGFALGVKRGLGVNIACCPDLRAAYGAYMIGKDFGEIDQVAAFEARPSMQGVGVGAQGLYAAGQSGGAIGRQCRRTRILEIGQQSIIVEKNAGEYGMPSQVFI